MGKITEMSYLFWVISLIFSASKLVDKNFFNPFWKEVSDSKLHEIPFIPSMMISFIPPGHWLLKMGIPKALASTVRHAHRIAAAGEKRQHDHRIHAPRNGQQDAVVVRRQVILGDISLESL